jgi:hypothetical protein
MGRDTLGFIKARVYEDFIMPSRLNEYRDILHLLIEAGYSFSSVRDYWKRRDHKHKNNQPTVVLRHDIDTDLATARRMWEIENEIGITSSFYFRLQTFDPALMAQIEAHGGESGYHYEEVATIAKRYGLFTAAAINNHMSEIRELFASNIQMMRSKSGLPVEVVASHGDFINRKIGIPNWVLLDNAEFRLQNGINLEVYDKEFMGLVDERISDSMHPVHWKPTAPAELLRKKLKPELIYILVHPRHWRKNLMENLADDINRVIEHLVYGMRHQLSAEHK